MHVLLLCHDAYPFALNMVEHVMVRPSGSTSVLHVDAPWVAIFHDQHMECGREACKNCRGGKAVRNTENHWHYSDTVICMHLDCESF